MQARSVSLGEMFAWIPATFRWFQRGSTTLLGASGILLVGVIALMTPMYAIMFASMRSGQAAGMANPMAAQSTLFWVVYAVTIVVSTLLFPPMLAGWFRLARDVDAGAPVAAMQVLQPYRDPVLWGRTLVFALLAFLVYLLVFALFAAAFYAPYSSFMAQVQAQQAAIAAGHAPPQPDFPWVLIPAYFLFLGTMMVAQFVYMVGFAEVALRPTSALDAMRLALQGVVRNLLKLIVLVFVLFVAMMLVMVVLVLLLSLLVAALSMISPMLGIVVMLALYVPLVLVMYPLMFGGNYFVWKDMLGGAEPDTDLQA